MVAIERRLVGQRRHLEEARRRKGKASVDQTAVVAGESGGRRAMAREDSKTDQLCRCNDASFHQGRRRKPFRGNELPQTELASQCGESSCCITQGGVRESAAVWGTLLAGAFLFSVFLTIRY